MGTIKGSVMGTMSSMGSDFDANNRTMGVSTNKNSTIRQDIGHSMRDQIRTEYDRPWVSKQERESTKDYLRATA